MKNENSIDRIIQVNDSNIGNNIATLRKSLNIKQTDMILRPAQPAYAHAHLSQRGGAAHGDTEADGAGAVRARRKGTRPAC